MPLRITEHSNKLLYFLSYTSCNLLFWYMRLKVSGRKAGSAFWTSIYCQQRFVAFNMSWWYKIMIAPGFPTSPHGTETKGEVEMARASPVACERLAISNVNGNRIKRNPFLYASSITLFTTTIWNTKHAFLPPSSFPTRLSLTFKGSFRDTSICCQLQHTYFKRTCQNIFCLSLTKAEITVSNNQSTKLW